VVREVIIEKEVVRIEEIVREVIKEVRVNSSSSSSSSGGGGGGGGGGSR
jgi:uncharacterized membrane protein